MSIVRWIVLVSILVLVFLYGLNAYVSSFETSIYRQVKEVPQKKAALLLGTAKYVAKGKQNYFYNRGSWFHCQYSY